MRRLFGDFFKGKAVLITGHTGFIGSWLSICLKELKARIIGYALSPYSDKDNFIVANLKDKLTNIYGDVRDFEKLNGIFQEYKPEIIYHLAAQPLVRKSYEIPKETFDVNVGGSVNVFEAFRNTPNSKILINFTTDKCYENLENMNGYCEEDRLGGYDPYSSSKACSELITTAYRKSFFGNNSIKNQKQVSSVRCGNVIGGGDWQEDRLIPDCMKAILNDQEILIRNPDAVRPWQYVLEPIRGMLMLSEKMWANQQNFVGAWNFGPPRSKFYSVQQIVASLIQKMGKGKYTVQKKDSSDDMHETKILLLNSDKAEKHLGWKSKIDITQTLEFVCDWYKEFNVDYDFNSLQIKKYVDLVNL